MDPLHNLVSFVQLKQHERGLWSVTFSKVADLACNFSTLLKATLLHGYFSRFLNCKYGI